MANRVTMADVAREADVSLMTVSRVVNEKGEVSPATRQRVLEVIEQLGYRPSAIARGLATQRTGSLGLVMPDVANPFFLMWRTVWNTWLTLKATTSFCAIPTRIHSGN
jgi:DNA-binding LacI/PurR family transcriptional regulator